MHSSGNLLGGDWIVLCDAEPALLTGPGIPTHRCAIENRIYLVLPLTCLTPLVTLSQYCGTRVYEYEVHDYVPARRGRLMMWSHSPLLAFPPTCRLSGSFGTLSWFT